MAFPEQVRTYISMIVRCRSPQGMVRWTVDSDEADLVRIVQLASQTWPTASIKSLRRGTPSAADLLTSSQLTLTLAQAAVANGEIFYVEFDKEKCLDNRLSMHSLTPANHTRKETLSSTDASCFNYKVFWYLRRYFADFKSSKSVDSET